MLGNDFHVTPPTNKPIVNRTTHESAVATLRYGRPRDRKGLGTAFVGDRKLPPTLQWRLFFGRRSPAVDARNSEPGLGIENGGQKAIPHHATMHRTNHDQPSQDKTH